MPGVRARRRALAVALSTLVLLAAAALAADLWPGDNHPAPSAAAPSESSSDASGDRSPAAAARKPNIVLVMTDDQRWDSLWAMPAVRRMLAGRGVTFSNGFVVNPLCCPSRASILTGQYSHTTGIFRNSRPYGGFGAFRDRSTVATWLQRAGYRTGYFGKYLNGYGPRSPRYVPPGWSRWFAFRGNGYYDYGLNVDGRVYPYRHRTIYSTDRLRTAAVRFIRRSQRPFFLVFAPYAPHEPSTPARRHANAFADLELSRSPNYNEADVSDKPAYVRALRPWSEWKEEASERLHRKQLATLLAVDDAVRAIVNLLANSGRLKDTMIVFTSDNGLQWGSHRISGKLVPYDESIRVPFVVRYDRLVRAPREDGRLALNIDLAPTFAALAGVRARGADGSSLLPLLRSTTAPWRARFLVEHLDGPGGPPVPTYCAVRSRSYSYVKYETGEEELYDMRADPYQLRNRAGDPAFAPKLRTMRERLKALCDPPPPGFTP